MVEVSLEDASARELCRQCIHKVQDWTMTRSVCVFARPTHTQRGRKKGNKKGCNGDLWSMHMHISACV